MSTTTVQLLRDEFDRLADAGRTVELWWRDDDATRDTAVLERLLGLSERLRAPVALAVIPAAIEASLVNRVADRHDVSVLVHGWRHANHAAAGEKPAEFGPHRPLPDLLRDAAQGLRETGTAFGSAVVPVFVPPWNRMAPELVPALPGLGYRAASAFGPAHGRTTDLALTRLDTQLDPVDWRGTRSLAHPARLAAALRECLATSAGPIGLLTHHLAFDEALWGFCERLLEVAASHQAVRLVSISDLVKGVEPPAPFLHSPSTPGRLGSPAVEAART